MTRCFAVALATVSISAAAVISAAPSLASAPTARLTPTHAKIAAGSRPGFSYSISNVPHGATRWVQRQEGTRHVWTNIVRVSGASGTVTAPALPRGKYYYRLHVIKNGSILANSQTQIIYAYGTVSLRQLCVHLHAAGCQSGTLPVGSATFNYVWKATSDNNGLYDAVGSMGRTSCRSLTLKFVRDRELDDQPADGPAHVKVSQANAAAQLAYAAPETVGRHTFRLTGAAFTILDSTDDGGAYVAYNGSASCYTSSGTR